MIGKMAQFFQTFKIKERLQIVHSVHHFDFVYFPFFSSQVLFLICRKLTSQQMVNGTEVLKWLREILICRNKFLLKNKVDSAALLLKERVSLQNKTRTRDTTRLKQTMQSLCSLLEL